MATTTPFTSTGTLPVAAGSLVSNPTATVTQIKSILLHNTNTTAETVQIYLVPNVSNALGTPALTNRIDYIQLAANETLEIDTRFPLTLSGQNDAIFVQTTTAGKVVSAVSGVKTA